MAYFSRLTDIVTCNLSAILAEADDPLRALEEILEEMQQGMAGAQRSMKTAIENETRLKSEIKEQQQQINFWIEQAKEHLSNEEEQLARQDLLRKHEVENLIAGLEQQLQAATSTREHLTTMFHALEARYADAQRRQAALAADAIASESNTAPASDVQPPTSPDKPSPAPDAIELELESLKQQIEQQRQSD